MLNRIKQSMMPKWETARKQERPDVSERPTLSRNNSFSYVDKDNSVRVFSSNTGASLRNDKNPDNNIDQPLHIVTFYPPEGMSDEVFERKANETELEYKDNVTREDPRHIPAAISSL